MQNIWKRDWIGGGEIFGALFLKMCLFWLILDAGHPFITEEQSSLGSASLEPIVTPQDVTPQICQVAYFYDQSPKRMQ